MASEYVGIDLHRRRGVPVSDLFGKAGRQLIADAQLARAYRLRVASLFDLIDAYDYEVEFFRQRIAEELAGHPGYHAIQAIPGVGPTFAAIFVAEIGDVHQERLGHGIPARCRCHRPTSAGLPRMATAGGWRTRH